MFKALAALLLCAALGTFANAQTLGGPFSLTGVNGSGNSADYAGKYMLIMFGYSACDDSCVPALKSLTEAVAKLPADKAAKVAPIMITVDPERDTPAMLAPFISSISPRLVGITGSRAGINAVMQQYMMRAQRTNIPTDPQFLNSPDVPSYMKLGYMYFVPSMIYVMSPQNTFYSMLQGDTKPDALAKQLTAIIK